MTEGRSASGPPQLGHSTAMIRATRSRRTTVVIFILSGLLRVDLGGHGGRLDSPESMTRLMDDDRAAPVVDLDFML